MSEWENRLLCSNCMVLYEEGSKCSKCGSELVNSLIKPVTRDVKVPADRIIECEGFIYIVKVT